MSPAGRRRRGKGDDGFAAGLEGLIFGVLFFVIGTLFIGYAWGVVDTRAATEQAARQAVRTYVEAPDAALAAAAARQAADSALSGYGRNPALGTLALVSGSFSRCARVTISVGYPAPLLELPVLGRLGRSQTVHSRHSELVDPFRSGIGGSSACA